jgi:flagellar biosynthesis/type III secretory pathway M-ring protein FliF/YscJ
MAWWAWLIIWTVLVLGLFAMLGLLGYRLFRKFMAAMAELETLSEKAAQLADNVEELKADPTERAIELGYAEVARRRERLVARREEIKQARREARLQRGKLLVKPDSVQTLRKWTNAR